MGKKKEPPIRWKRLALQKLFIFNRVNWKKSEKVEVDDDDETISVKIHCSYEQYLLEVTEWIE